MRYPHLRTIGHGATISAPHMHAHACENLLDMIELANDGGAILDVGSGSGYRMYVLQPLTQSLQFSTACHLARGLSASIISEHL